MEEESFSEDLYENMSDKINFFFIPCGVGAAPSEDQKGYLCSKGGISVAMAGAHGKVRHTT